MLYIDTCVLVPLFIPENASDKTRTFFAENANQPMAISTWTQTEFVSAVSFKVRSRQIEPSSALNIIRTFQEVAESSFTILLPTLNDYDRSQEYLMQFDTGLRAGDALHLAIARQQHAMLVSLDQLMLSAASTLSVSATTF